MKLTKYIACLLAGTTLFSCENFDEINTNPDATDRATASLIATGAIMGIMKPSTGKNFVSHQFVTKHLAWSETIEPLQYNKFGRDGFDGYTSLKDYKLMVEYADQADMSDGKKNAYKGLALFLKAYRLFNYTISMGDIPYKGILEGKEGNLTVAYNTQKEVFTYLLEDLDNAHKYFSNASAFDGDPIFKGNVSKWTKQVCALEMRVLITLSKKESDKDLNVAAKFAEVAQRGPLMESNSDNLQLVFSDVAGQLYPFNKSVHNHSIYPVMSSTVTDVLKENKDYRLFYYSAPSSAQLKAGLTESDWDAYIGIDPSMPFNDISTMVDAGQYCTINKRYVEYVTGEPFIRIGYAEQNFILAEAALRGWITADASMYYKKGIEGSMFFAADNTPDNKNYHHGRKITDDIIVETLASPTIQLDGTFESDLKKIMTQKYLAGFMQLPYLAYYDYRRTGYPEFPIDPETNMNSYEPTKIPTRWMYPNSEYDYNKENVEAAVQRQYNGSDDVNALMWILK